MMRCLSIYSYIKPQHNTQSLIAPVRCLSIYSYIKPQQSFCRLVPRRRCLSIYSYIKPQLLTRCGGLRRGVYLSIPTSNHNRFNNNNPQLGVFIYLFLHQTTTLVPPKSWQIGVFIYLFLHQTTTCGSKLWRSPMVFIYLFLHQTTT